MTTKQKIACHSIIHAASVAAAGVGVAPIVNLADSILIVPIQVVMTISLGRVFGKELSSVAAEEAIRDAGIAAFVGQTASKLVIKGIPVIGNAANGTIAASLTESLGWIVAKKLDKETSL